MKIAKLFLLVSLSILIYAFSLDGDFVFDDSEAVVKNADVNLHSNVSLLFGHDFWGADIKSKTSHKSYRPLTVLSFRFNTFLNNNKLKPYYFKLTNVLIHVLVTLTVYIFLRKIFYEQSFNKKRRKHRNPSNKSVDDNNSLWSDDAFLSSCLFAVHPIHVEAVAGVVGRADILCAVFFFAAILFYDRSIPKIDNSRYRVITRTKLKNYIYFIVTILCAVISMLCKELGITCLAFCSVYDTVMIQEISAKSIKNRLRELANCKTLNNAQNNGDTVKVSKKTGFIDNLARVIGKLVINHKAFVVRQVFLVFSTAVMIYARWAVMDFRGPVFQNIDNPASFSKSSTARVATYNYLYFINFLLLIWPQWLCFDWSMGCIPILNGFNDPRIIFVFIFWTFIAGLLYRICSHQMNGSQKRVYLMSLLLMFISFLPASNLILPVGFVIAERILYIPSTGFCMLVVTGYRNLIENVNQKCQKLLQFGFLILLLILALRSVERSAEWLNERALFNSALNVCPLNAKVHYNVGKNAGDRNQLKIAEDEYRIAISLNSKYYQAMNNLANLLKDQSRFVEAEKLLKDALAIKDDFPAAWMNLGIVLANLKQPRAAENAYMKALSFRKNYADCYYNLGNLFLEDKKHKLALQAWSEATRINPTHVVAWSNTLALLDNTGQITQALKLAKKALETLPDVASIHFNVANLMGKSGDFASAEEHFKYAIRLKGSETPAVYFANLGVLYHRWKKAELAIEMYKKALTINPMLKSAKDNMDILIKDQSK